MCTHNGSAESWKEEAKFHHRKESIRTKSNNWSLHSNFKEGETLEAHSIASKLQLGSPQQREATEASLI